MNSRKLVLASRSPRRRQLLTDAGYQFSIVLPDEAAEYGIASRETPREMVRRLAYQKAADVARRVDAGTILGCDTLVECQGRILGKPRDGVHARRMLQLLCGRVHHVYSGICLWQRPEDRTLIDADVTKLKMDVRSDEELNSYLKTNAWQGKAGAFGFQDGLDWIRIVSGSESNVVGLPLELLQSMLRRMDIPE